MSWMYAAWQGIKQVGKAAMADPGTAGGSGYGGNGMTNGGEVIVDGSETGEAGLMEKLGGALSSAGDGGAFGIGKALAGGDPEAITQQLMGGANPMGKQLGAKKDAAKQEGQQKAAAGKAQANQAKSNAGISKQTKTHEMEKEQQMNEIYGKQNEFGSQKKRKGALS